MSPLSRPKKPEARPMARCLDARVKLLAALVAVVCVVATPVTQWQRHLAYGVLLVIGFVLVKAPAKFVLKRLIPMGGLLLMFALALPLLPILPGHGLERATSPTGLIFLASLVTKSVFSVWVMLLLLASSSPDELLAGLYQLRVPNTAVALISFIYRYFHLLSDEAMRMHRAQTSRGTPRSFRRRLRVWAGMATALLVRSYERSERIAVAMVCRGFDGAFPKLEPSRLSASDLLAVLLLIAVPLVIAIWPR